MTLFSEIYGAYFRIAAAVLERESLTAEDIGEIVSSEGFRESVLFVPRKLIPGENSWALLREEGKGRYTRTTKQPPVTVITELQKRWLKSKLSDPKLALFLTDEELRGLEERLKDTEPLYTPEQIRTVDAFSDGDDYTDPFYRSTFRELVRAIDEGEIMHICYCSGSRMEKHGFFLPRRMEYSPKNDKFRVYCIRCRYGNLTDDMLVINLGRITELRRTGEKPGSTADTSVPLRNTRHAGIKVESSIIEDFLTEFSSFEKRTEIDDTTCTVTLWYDRNDETELLIQLLSFGPSIEILTPPELRKQAAERVRRQYRLLFGEDKG